MFAVFMMNDDEYILGKCPVYQGRTQVSTDSPRISEALQDLTENVKWKPDAVLSVCAVLVYENQDRLWCNRLCYCLSQTQLWWFETQLLVKCNKC